MKITDFSYKTEMKVTTCLRRPLPSFVTSQFNKWNSMSFTEGFRKHFISLLSGIENEENRSRTLYIFKKIKHPNQNDQGVKINLYNYLCASNCFNNSVNNSGIFAKFSGASTKEIRNCVLPGLCSPSATL